MRRTAGDLPPIDCAFVAVAAILLGQALQVNNGFYDPAALLLVAASALSCGAALFRLPSRLVTRGVGNRALTIVLLTGVLSNIMTLATSSPAFYIRDEFWPPSPVFYTAIAAAALASVLIVVDSRRARTVWFIVALSASGVLGIWLIHVSPHPHVDVLTVYSASLYALREGLSPYSVSFTNVYGHTGYYAPGMTSGSEVQFGFPYLPLALLMVLPGRAVGDIRYADLAALLVGAACIARMGRGIIAPLAAMMLLFTPRTLFVLEQGWSEPLAICWLGVLMLVASRGLTGGMPLGLLIAVKQHLTIALLFAPWLNARADRSSLGVIGKAIGVAAFITVPFIVWDPVGFWRSVAALQFNEPFRVDSLSVLAAFARLGWKLPALTLLLVPLGALAAGCWIASRYSPRTPSGFALSLGFCLLLLFAFSKKAFCNYYYLVIAALAAAVAAVTLPPTESEEGDPRPADTLVRAGESHGNG